MTMKKLVKQFSPLLSDIRAPQSFGRVNLSNRQWLRVGILLLGDLVALALAWQFARDLNHFYAAPPPQLIWWVWLGLPSLFWCFAAMTILFFAYGGVGSVLNLWIRPIAVSALTTF
jgi:hypothetical protein